MSQPIGGTGDAELRHRQKLGDGSELLNPAVKRVVVDPATVDPALHAKGHTVSAAEPGLVSSTRYDVSAPGKAAHQTGAGIVSSHEATPSSAGGAATGPTSGQQAWETTKNVASATYSKTAETAQAAKDSEAYKTAEIAAAKAATKVQVGAAHAYDVSKQKAGEAYTSTAEYLKEKAAQAYEVSKDAASAAASKVQETAASAYETGKQYVQHGSNVAAEKAQQAGAATQDAAQRTAEQAKVQASHAYNVAAQKTQQAGAAVQDSAQRTTEQAKEKAGQAYNVAAEKTQQAGAATQNAAQRTTQQAKETAGQAYDYTQAKAGQAYDSAAQGTKQARDFTQAKAGQAYDSAAQGAKQAQDYTQTKAGQAYDSAAQGAKQAQDYTQDRAGRAYDSAQQGANQASDYMQDKANQAYGSTVGQAGHAAGGGAGASHTGGERGVKDYNAQVLDALKAGAQPTTVGAATQHPHRAAYSTAMGAGTGVDSGFDSSLAPGVMGHAVATGATPSSLAGTVPVGALGETTPVVGGSAGHTSAVTSSGVTAHSSVVGAPAHDYPLLLY